MIEALRRRHADGVVLVEALGRIDALAFDPDGRRLAYEIKTSSGDFIAEVRHPDKRRYAVELAHEFWFAVPAPLAYKVAGHLPRGCGLAAIDEALRVHVIVQAPGLDPRELSGPELTALLRHRMRPRAERRRAAELQRIRGREQVLLAELDDLRARCGLTTSGSDRTVFAVHNEEAPLPY